MKDQFPTDLSRYAPFWLQQLGIRSWLFIGLTIAVIILLVIASILSTIISPMIIAALAAILTVPLVNWLEKHHLPRTLGTILAIILILVVVITLISMVVQGIVQQLPEIRFQIQIGWSNLNHWFLEEFDYQLPPISVVRSNIEELLPEIFAGVFGFLGNTVNTVVAFFFGVYIGVFMLFFFLRDSRQLENWLAHQIDRKPETGTRVLHDANTITRRYFQGTGLTALITSLVVIIPLALLKVPLIIPIFLVYFFTSFIPYLGAWIGGAFAVMIALGSGGIETALIVLTAVIISNGALQSAVNSWAVGSMLKVHPLLVFLVTIIAGAIGGILAMILAVPLVAIVLNTIRIFREARE